MKTYNYFHNTTTHQRKSIVSAIACILIRNISNGIVSDNLEIELAEFWNQTDLEFPDKFMEYEVYDNLKIESGNFLSELDILLENESCDYVIERFEGRKESFIEAQLN